MLLQSTEISLTSLVNIKYSGCSLLFFGVVYYQVYVENSYQLLVLSISGTTLRFIDRGGISLMFMSQ